MTRRLCALFLAVALPAALTAFFSAPSVAAPKFQQRGDIFIANDGEFDKEHGIRRGKGTKKNPFVISHWDVSSIVIKDTSKHLEIKNNNVSNQLILDWNGDRLNVHHNHIGDLRVNQNVERTGEATDGRIHHNTFGVVGQLRHWDGVFERNKVGSPSVLAKRGSHKAMQFDGFHGSKLRNNTFYGYVDVKLHGHHHGSGFKKGSHYHGGEGGYDAGNGPHKHSVDHSRRYHQVSISNNKIYSDHAWALRYYDEAHSGDDRTNASETNKFLNCPHVHFTHVTMRGNILDGGGLVVDVFNAFDENHWGTKRGSVDLINNRITLDRDLEDVFFGRNGITVQHAVDMNLHVAGNTIQGPDQVAEGDILKLESKLNSGAGINLLNIDEAEIHIHDNLVTHKTFGVMASQFTDSVKWWIGGLRTADVQEKVHYDDSVANRPRQG